MSRRHELERHRHSLGEIREIMNAMKTLAYMETRKVARFLNAQQAVVDNIEAAAADFITFHSDALPETETEIPVYLLIGTERGFCGDINQSLLRQFEAAQQHTAPGVTARLLAVGHKLHTLLQDDGRVSAFIDGTNVAEEIDTVLEQVVHELVSLQSQLGALTLYAFYHGGENGIVMNRLMPPFQTLHHTEISYAHPPVLNLSPADFLLELTDHYLFAALNEMLYSSLMAENDRRVSHLEGAVQHLDDESATLLRKGNALRQEEITEEIEVILLSADSLLTDVKKRTIQETSNRAE